MSAGSSRASPSAATAAALPPSVRRARRQQSVLCRLACQSSAAQGGQYRILGDDRLLTCAGCQTGTRGLLQMLIAARYVDWETAVCLAPWPHLGTLAKLRHREFAIPRRPCGIRGQSRRTLPDSPGCVLIRRHSKRYILHPTGVLRFVSTRHGGRFACAGC